MFFDQSSVTQSYRQQAVQYTTEFEERIRDLKEQALITNPKAEAFNREAAQIRTGLIAAKTPDEILVLTKQLDALFHSLYDDLKQTKQDSDRALIYVFESWDAQFLEDFDDLNIISQGLSIAIVKNKPIEPFTIHIPRQMTIFVGGKELILPEGNHRIEGTPAQALDQIRAIHRALTEPVREARIRAEGLEQVIKTLKRLYDSVPTVAAGESFIAEELPEDRKIISALENAQLNVQRSRNLLQRSQLFVETAQASLLQAQQGLEQAEQDEDRAGQSLVTAGRNVEQARVDAQTQFEEMVELLTGSEISKYVVSRAANDEMRFSVSIDRSDVRHKSLIDNLDGLTREAEQAILGGRLKEFYKIYGQTISMRYDEPSAGRAIGALRDMKITWSQGLFTIRWDPQTPDRFYFDMSFKLSDDGTFSVQRYRMLHRHMQATLRRIASEGDYTILAQKVEQVSKSVLSYQNAATWAHFLEQLVDQAMENRREAEENLRISQEYLKIQEFEQERAKENLRRKQSDFQGAQDGLIRAQRDADDEVTPSEAQGIFESQGQPSVKPESDEMLDDTNIVPEKTAGFSKEKILSQVFARIVYLIVGYIMLLFNIDSARRILNKRAVKREKEKLEQQDKASKGLLGKLVKFFAFESVTVTEVTPFSARRVENLASNKKQFKRIFRLMRDWGVDTFAVVASKFKDEAKLVDIENLTFRSIFGNEKIKELGFQDRWVYRTRLLLRLFRSKYDDFISTGTFKIAWIAFSIIAGLTVFPLIGFPTLPLEVISNIPLLWGGAPLLGPMIYLTPTIALPGLAWVFILLALPRLLYTAVVMIPVVLSVAKLIIFIGYSLFKYLFTKTVLYSTGLIVKPVWVGLQLLFRKKFIFKYNFEGLRSLPDKLMTAISSGIKKLTRIGRRSTPAGKDFSREFSQGVIQKAKDWALANSNKPLEQWDKAEAKKLIDSFIIEETVRSTKNIIFQDEGNSLRVNVGEEVDDLLLSPGISASMPAIYVPFYLPERRHFNKWFWGILIQNITQSLQYAASMGSRGVRGAERGANVKHRIFSHIISKSELDIHSFLFMVQPRWLVGHLHVVREELIGGRIVIDLDFIDARELNKKEAPEGVEQWDNVEDYVRYLVDRRADTPEMDAETLHQMFTGDLQIEFNLPDDMPADQREAFQEHVRSQFDQLVKIAAGYYRLYPDEYNPFYGPGENVTFSGHFPDVNPIDDADREGLGTYQPTEGVFYVRGNLYGGFNYAPGGVEIVDTGDGLIFSPTDEVCRVEYTQKEDGTGGKVSSTKATNLNAILLVIQAQTYLDRKVVRDADGTEKLVVQFKDAHEEHAPQIAQAREQFEEQSQQRDTAFRKAWLGAAKKQFVKIYDIVSKSYISVDLGSRLGFEPFKGVRGVLARWKTLTIGAVIGVLPVSLYGLLQDPLNAAMQAAYNPVLVEKESRLRIHRNTQEFVELGTQIDLNRTALTNNSVVLGDATFTFPEPGSLQTTEQKETFARSLYQMTKKSGVHVSEDLFISNAHLLTNSYADLVPFFIAVEQARLEQRRRENGGELNNPEKALTEYGVSLLNAQDYLTALSEIFNQESDEQKALLYLASTIGNTDEAVTLEMTQNGQPLPSDEVSQMTAYQVAVYKRTSQQYMASYNYIARMTSHGSNEDDAHRSGAVERPLGERNREPLIRLGQERNELQFTRSWAFISPKGPTNIFQMKTMAKRIRNGDRVPQATVFMEQLVRVANLNGTPIDRIIIHDGQGGTPSNDPSEWHLIIVSDSMKFMTKTADIMNIIIKAQNRGELPAIDLNPANMRVIHRDGFNTLEKFDVLTNDNHELEQYDNKISDINSMVTKILLRRIIKPLPVLGVADETDTIASIKGIAGVLGNPAELTDQISQIEKSAQNRNRLSSFITNLFSIDKKNLFDKIVVTPFSFIIKHSLLIGAAALVIFGPVAVFSAISTAILLPFVAPASGILPLVGYYVLAAYTVVGLALSIPASFRNYLYTFRFYSGLRKFKNAVQANLETDTSLKDKLALLGNDEIVQLHEALGIADVSTNDSSALRSILVELVSDDPFMTESHESTLKQAEIIESALVDGVMLEPSTVDEEYIATATPDESGKEQSFQDFNYSHTAIEPNVETVADEFARVGQLFLDNLRRAASENPHELMRSINKYIDHRKKVESSLGVTDRFEYVSLEDIGALAELSRDLKNDGYLDLSTESHRRDVKILGKVFGLQEEDAFDMISSYWSEAQWPVTMGIPFMPGSTKFRFRIATRGGNIESTPPIPLLTAIMTFSEPPWLAGFSAFNIIDTQADDPAFALAEDTKFGIMGVFNPPLYPNTPAISIHMKDYIEEQYERRLMGENSFRSAAQLGKAFSTLHGIDLMFSHPLFTHGATEETQADWREIMRTVFNSKALRRDEIAYLGAGRGSGWLNYIIFGYTLYGHEAQRIGAFPPGVAQAVRQLQYIRELDSTMDGRLLKIIRYLQVVNPAHLLNGLGSVDFRLAYSIAKGMEGFNVPGKTTDQIIDELIQIELREVLEPLSLGERHKAFAAWQSGNELYGHELGFPADMLPLEAESVEQTPQVITAIDGLTDEEKDILSELGKNGFDQDDINDIFDHIKELSPDTRLAALKNILTSATVPISDRDGTRDILWQFRFTKAIPRDILRTRFTKNIFSRVLSIAFLAGSVMLWGWGGMVIPILFTISEIIGVLRGTSLKNFFRLGLGAASVVLMVYLTGGIGALTIPHILMLYLYLVGGRQGANWLLYAMDRIPIRFMERITDRYNRASLEDKLQNLKIYDEYSPEIKKEIIKEVITSIDSHPQTPEEYDHLFQQRYVLTSLEETYFERMRVYFKAVYGDQAEQVEQSVQDSLSKFPVDQRLRIVRQIHKRLSKSFQKGEIAVHMLTHIKPTDKLTYTSRFGLLRKYFSSRQKEKLFRGIAITFVLGAIGVFLGIPVTGLGIAGTMVAVSMVWFLGTKTFEQTTGTITGILLPILHMAMLGFTASFMPIVVILSEIVGGYLVGSTIGLILKHSYELGYNFILLPFIINPWRTYKNMDRLTQVDPQLQQRLLLSSIIPLMNEVTSDLEFVSKFNALYLDTIASMIDDEDLGSDDTGSQTPDSQGTPPSTDPQAPDSQGTPPSTDPTDTSPDLDSGPQQSDTDAPIDQSESAVQAQQDRINNVTNMIGEKIGLTPEERSHIQNAIQNMITIPGSMFENIAPIIDALPGSVSSQSIRGILLIAAAIEESSNLSTGMMLALDRALVGDMIPREMYNAVIELVFRDRNREFIALLTDAWKSELGLIEEDINRNRDFYLATLNENIEDPDGAEEVRVSTQVDTLFQSFNPDADTDQLREYLDRYESGKTLKPTVDAISENPVLGGIPRIAPNPSTVLQHILRVTKQAELDIHQTGQLLRILEESGYILSNYGDQDVIILDFATFDLSSRGNENRGNQDQKQMLLQHMDMLRERYTEAGRFVQFVVFSDELDTSDVKGRLGEGISQQIQFVFGRESLDENGAEGSPERYLKFFMDRILNQGINRLNMKVFSNNHAVMDTAGRFGTMLAGREGNIFDAFLVFANLHPGVETADLYPLSEAAGINGVLTPDNIILLGGQEISLQGAESPLKGRAINRYSLIDQSA